MQTLSRPLIHCFAAISCLVVSQVGCVVSQPHCNHGCPHHRGQTDVFGDLARTFERVVVGVSYDESLRTGQAIVDGYSEPLPPPVEENLPPELVEKAPASTSVETVGFGSPGLCTGAPACGPPGRFFPVPARPVFSPQPLEGQW